jgi:hypothetical protein
VDWAWRVQTDEWGGWIDTRWRIIPLLLLLLLLLLRLLLLLLLEILLGLMRWAWRAHVEKRMLYLPVFVVMIFFLLMLLLLLLSVQMVSFDTSTSSSFVSRVAKRDRASLKLNCWHGMLAVLVLGVAELWVTLVLECLLTLIV